MASGAIRHVRRKIDHDKFSQASDLIQRFPEIGANGQCYGLTVKWMIKDDFMRKLDDVKTGDDQNPLIQAIVSLNDTQATLSKKLPPYRTETVRDEDSRLRAADRIIADIVDQSDCDRVLFQGTKRHSNVGHATGLRVTRNDSGSIKLKYFDANF